MSAPLTSPELGARVAACDPSQLLPVRRQADRQEPLRSPALLDALDLDSGRWLLVLEVAGELLVSAVVEQGEGLRRARVGDGVMEELLARTAKGDDRNGFTFRRLGAIGGWSGERSIDVDQSNDSVVVGDAAVVKRLVYTVPGNERPMLPAHLVAAGFDEMPAPLGNAGWHHADGVAPLVSISTYLPDARDGWDWYVDLLGRSVEDRAVDAFGPAAELGAMTARLHGALATPTEILPAPTTVAGKDVVAGWGRNAEADLDAAIAAIDGDEGSRLRERAGTVRDELARIGGIETVSMPIHGDLHVGQFLRWRGGLAVSDLDGDPLGPGSLAGSAARDVASLVQSLDHVGRIVERRRGESLVAWIREASARCLAAYRDELASLGASALFDERLVRPLRVAQELHEFVYAARYLPSWRYVPDRALAALLDDDA